MTDMELETLVRRWADGYLPMDCPNCGRRRLEYGLNENGNVILVRCEKCGCTNWEVARLDHEQTEKIRLWRYYTDGEFGRWRAGPTPADIGSASVEFAWALVADAPMEATGRAAATPDQLIGFIESRDATFSLVRQDYGDRLWVANISWWNNGERNLNAGDTTGIGDTAIAAVIAVLENLGVPQ